MDWGDDQLIEWENYPLASIRIEKTDAETGDPISGVKFEFFDKNKESIGTYITDSKGEIHLDMPLLDTRRGKDLMGTFLSDIVLQVLSFVAENERSNIRQRQAEGIATAKARGVKFGRPPKPLPENFHTIYQRWRNGKITGTKAAEECNMPITTFRYKADIYEKTNFL